VEAELPSLTSALQAYLSEQLRSRYKQNGAQFSLNADGYPADTGESIQRQGYGLDDPGPECRWGKETSVLRSALFGDFTQRRVVVSYRRFGKTYRSHSKWPNSPVKIGQIGCPETSVRNYHSTLRKIPKERRSHLHRGGSL
jgi:hypothetical protein